MELEIETQKYVWRINVTVAMWNIETTAVQSVCPVWFSLRLGKNLYFEVINEIRRYIFWPFEAYKQKNLLCIFFVLKCDGSRDHAMASRVLSVLSVIAWCLHNK